MSYLKDIIEAYIEYNKDKMPDKLDALNVLLETEIEKEIREIQKVEEIKEATKAIEDTKVLRKEHQCSRREFIK